MCSCGTLQWSTPFLNSFISNEPTTPLCLVSLPREGIGRLSCTACTAQPPQSAGRMAAIRLHARPALRKACAPAHSLTVRPLSEVRRAPISPEEANLLVHETKFGQGGIAQSPKAPLPPGPTFSPTPGSSP